MAVRGPNRGRFCSRSCVQQSRPIRTDTPTYGARHYRVRTTRGNAASHPCVDCGNPAYDWSQIHGTKGEEPEHYAARCRPCHRLYDESAGESHCRARLTEAQVREIHANPMATHAELGRLYGVNPATVRDVRRGRT